MSYVWDLSWKWSITVKCNYWNLQTIVEIRITFFLLSFQTWGQFYKKVQEYSLEKSPTHYKSCWALLQKQILKEITFEKYLYFFQKTSPLLAYLASNVHLAERPLDAKSERLNIKHNATCCLLTIHSKTCATSKLHWYKKLMLLLVFLWLPLTLIIWFTSS